MDDSYEDYFFNFNDFDSLAASPYLVNLDNIYSSPNDIFSSSDSSPTNNFGSSPNPNTYFSNLVMNNEISSNTTPESDILINTTPESDILYNPTEISNPPTLVSNLSSNENHSENEEKIKKRGRKRHRIDRKFISLLFSYFLSQ